MYLNDLNASKPINQSLKTFDSGGEASPDCSGNPLWIEEEQRLKRKAGNLTTVRQVAPKKEKNTKNEKK